MSDLDLFKNVLENTTLDLSSKEIKISSVGRVNSYKDGIILTDGLESAMSGEFVYIVFLKSV